MSRGLFIGRFQPFHLGHQNTIDFALSKVEDLIIIIGSSQSSYEIRNPFTAGERISMLKESLDANKKLDHKRILLIPIPDINIHSLWTSHVDLTVPEYDIVFTNDPYTCLLFKEKRVPVVSHKLYQRKYLSGTEIRKRMVESKKWEHLTTTQAAKIIKDIKGVERIKKLALINHLH